MGKVIRYCKMKEEHDGPNCFDISRPNIFGNPYTHIKNRETKALVVVKNRDEAIKLYDKYFDRMLMSDAEFKAEWDRMYDAYVKYDTVYLGCYCNEDESCHADIISKKLKQRAVRAMISNIKANAET